MPKISTVISNKLTYPTRRRRGRGRSERTVDFLKGTGGLKHDKHVTFSYIFTHKLGRRMRKVQMKNPFLDLRAAIFIVFRIHCQQDV